MIIQNLPAQEMKSSTETKEETKMILQCAENIMGHLNRLMEKDAQVKYATHKEVLGKMINSCEMELGQVFSVRPSLS